MFNWTPDGRQILLLESGPDEHRIMLVDVATGAARHVHTLPRERYGNIQAVFLDPTGRNISLVAGNARDEIRAMDGLDAQAGRN